MPHEAGTQLLATEDFVFLLKFIPLQCGLWEATFQGRQCSQAGWHSSCYAAGWLEANAVPNIEQYLLARTALSRQLHTRGSSQSCCISCLENTVGF